jgi:transposase
VINVPAIFKNVTDHLVICKNDPHQLTYRLITFYILDTKFLLLTNRLELTTFQVILLYAYRWQVELIFRFLKRTMNALHLFKHNQEGLQIQFYLLLITALLELKLKQKCVEQIETQLLTDNVTSESSQRTQECGKSPYDFLKTIGKKLHKYWKIGIHWLKILQNRIASPFDFITIELLGEA